MRPEPSSPTWPPDRRPLYPVGVAGELLGVHPRTLRIYEQKGLLWPARRSGKRYYSNDDLCWVRCILDFNRGKGISLAGIRRLLDFVPCWGIRHPGLTRTAAGPGERRAAAELSGRAYAGEAAAECLGCGNYRHGMGSAQAADGAPGAAARWARGTVDGP